MAIFLETMAKFKGDQQNSTFKLESLLAKVIKIDKQKNVLVELAQQSPTVVLLSESEIKVLIEGRDPIILELKLPFNIY